MALLFFFSKLKTNIQEFDFVVSIRTPKEEITKSGKKMYTLIWSYKIFPSKLLIALAYFEKQKHAMHMLQLKVSVKRCIICSIKKGLMAFSTS